MTDLLGVDDCDTISPSALRVITATDFEPAASQLHLTPQIVLGKDCVSFFAMPIQKTYLDT